MKPSGRFRPVAIEAEQAVLGGLLISAQAIERIEGRVSEADFFRIEHRLIFRAICQLAERNQPWDAVTLAEWFDAHASQYKDVVSGYILELASTTPSASNVTACADIVREKATLRQIIDVCTASADRAFNPEGLSSEEVLTEAENRLLAIANSRQRPGQGFVIVRNALKAALVEVSRRHDNPGASIGLSTGFIDLDRMTTGGLQPADLVILAARPSMGKTALALNIAEHAVMHSGKAVAVFSMEMSIEQLAYRLISSLGRINAQRLRTGQLEYEDWSRMSQALVSLSDLKLFIDDTPALSPAELRSRARRLAREQELGLIVVDYLQLMQVPGNKENRATEISEISRSLKALAKELNLPVIALSQLNRSLEQRSDKRPIMSDLRESGAIEQDTDIIMFIYRDEYYHPDSPDKGLAEVIIGKQRNGPTGTVKLAFRGQYTRFENAASGVSGRFE
ncbi:replicative DNA helicase [Denitratimonas sp. CY0512]|uniref:replicative DNA helicase n=1 Tax=Denitratimonas sp. CY0512 TaxID=3131940 RepID=UPI0030AEBBBE